MESDDVVLRPAYVWDCPACGQRDIYGGLVEAELTDDQRAELERVMGVDEFNDAAGEAWKGEVPEFVMRGSLVTFPNAVTCPGCGKTSPAFINPADMMPPGFDPRPDL